MFVRVKRSVQASGTYEYLQIVASVREGTRVRQRVVGTLGRRDQLPPQKIDRLIEHLRKLASPEGLRGIRLSELVVQAAREYGPVLAARQLWHELGLDQLLRAVGGQNSIPSDRRPCRDA